MRIGEPKWDGPKQDGPNWYLGPNGTGPNGLGRIGRLPLILMMLHVMIMLMVRLMLKVGDALKGLTEEDMYRIPRRTSSSSRLSCSRQRTWNCPSQMKPSEKSQESHSWYDTSIYETVGLANYSINAWVGQPDRGEHRCSATAHDHRASHRGGVFRRTWQGRYVLYWILILTTSIEPLTFPVLSYMHCTTGQQIIITDEIVKSRVSDMLLSSDMRKYIL
jgi:hypothetical protein